jgi:hypothetical protein
MNARVNSELKPGFKSRITKASSRDVIREFRAGVRVGFRSRMNAAVNRGLNRGISWELSPALTREFRRGLNCGLNRRVSVGILGRVQVREAQG